jgi:hypothetical protein
MFPESATAWFKPPRASARAWRQGEESGQPRSVFAGFDRWSRLVEWWEGGERGFGRQHTDVIVRKGGGLEIIKDPSGFDFVARDAREEVKAHGV